MRVSRRATSPSSRLQGQGRAARQAWCIAGVGCSAAPTLQSKAAQYQVLPHLQSIISSTQRQPPQARSGSSQQPTPVVCATKPCKHTPAVGHEQSIHPGAAAASTSWQQSTTNASGLHNQARTHLQSVISSSQVQPLAHASTSPARRRSTRMGASTPCWICAGTDKGRRHAD